MQCLTKEDLLSMLTCQTAIFDTRQFVVLNRTQPAGRLVFSVTGDGGKESVLYIEPNPRVQDLTKMATFSQLANSSSLRTLISQNKLSVLSMSPDGRYIQPMSRPEFNPIREGDIYLSGKTLPGSTVTLLGSTQTSAADSGGYFFLHVGIAKKPEIEVSVSKEGFKSTSFLVKVEDSNLGVVEKPDLIGMSVSSTILSGRTVAGATLTLNVGEVPFSTVSDSQGLFVLICEPLTSQIVRLEVSAVGYEARTFEYEPVKRKAILRVTPVDYLTNLVDGYTEAGATLRIMVDGQTEVTTTADENGIFSTPVSPIKGIVTVEALHKDYFNRMLEIKPKLAIFEYVAVDTVYSTHTAIVVRLDIPSDAEHITVSLVTPDGAMYTQVTYDSGLVAIVFDGLDLRNQVGLAGIEVKGQFFDTVTKIAPVIETHVLAEPHLLSFTEGNTSIQGLVGASSGTVLVRTPGLKEYVAQIQAKGKFVFILDEPVIAGLYEFEFEVDQYPKANFKFEPTPKTIKEV